MSVLARRDDGLVIDDDPDRVDLDATYAMVVGEGYWADARTAETVAAGRLLDVPVLDHLVIGHDAFISLRDRGISFDRSGGA